LFDSYQIDLRRAFERVALQEGFDLVVVMGRCPGDPNPVERVQNVLYDWITPQSVDGVVLLSGVLVNFLGTTAVEALVRRLGSLPKVSIGVEMLHVPSVTVDNRTGMRLATEHLLRVHDCRRIAYLAGPPDNQEVKARLEGYRYALEAHLLPFDERLVEHGPFSLASGMACMEAILARGEKFEAVIAANDVMALGAQQVLTARRQVPGHVPLLGFDDSPLATPSHLSSVAQPFNQLALQALKALQEAMGGRVARHVALSPRLALRNSCGCTDAVMRSRLPALEGLEPRVYLAKHRPALIKFLRDANGASFEWWSSRVERLLVSIEGAMRGHEEKFLDTLHALAIEAYTDGVPIEQIGKNLSYLQRHLAQGKGNSSGQVHVDRPSIPGKGNSGVQLQLERSWGFALSRAAATLGQLESKKHFDALKRSAALRQTSLRLWTANDERELATQLGSDLPKAGVRFAYLGILKEDSPALCQPFLQLGPSGAVTLGGPPHAVEQLVPAGFADAGAPSTLLVAVINSGETVRGILACDGGLDTFVFEQLRLEIGAMLELLATRRALASERAAASVPRSAEVALPGAFATPSDLETDALFGEARYVSRSTRPSAPAAAPRR
jgi:DNA-binding LacI/PurR family transcriptional regulator